MYLQFLNYVSYFFTAIFFIFLYFALDWSTIKIWWHNAKTSVLIKKKTAEATADGKRPFFFENGNVIIYAKTHPKALYDYKQLKQESRIVKRQLKKA